MLIFQGWILDQNKSEKTTDKCFVKGDIMENDQVDHLIEMSVILAVSEYKRTFEAFEDHVRASPEFLKAIDIHFWDLIP